MNPTVEWGVCPLTGHHDRGHDYYAPGEGALIMDRAAFRIVPLPAARLYEMMAWVTRYQPLSPHAVELLYYLEGQWDLMRHLGKTGPVLLTVVQIPPVTRWS